MFVNQIGMAGEVPVGADVLPAIGSLEELQLDAPLRGEGLLVDLRVTMPANLNELGTAVCGGGPIRE